MDKSTLPAAFKSIRMRLGESMRAFADRLGVTNPTISGYESGKIRPSRSMLLLLLPMAQGDERRPILDALGLDESDTDSLDQATVQTALESFETYLKAGGTGRGERSRDRERFAQAAKAVLDGDEIEPALIGIVEKWVAHRKSRKARQFFKNLDVYLDIELARFMDRKEKGK